MLLSMPEPTTTEAPPPPERREAPEKSLVFASEAEARAFAERVKGRILEQGPSEREQVIEDQIRAAIRDELALELHGLPQAPVEERAGEWTTDDVRDAVENAVKVAFATSIPEAVAAVLKSTDRIPDEATRYRILDALQARLTGELYRLLTERGMLSARFL